MTIRAIAGLLVFNGCVLAAALTLLWGLGAVRTWVDALRLCGVAYLLGIASLMIVLSAGLVVGVPVTGAMCAASVGAIGLVGLGIGVVSGRARPRVGSRWRVPTITPFVGIALAGIVVYLEALFRAARLSSTLGEWDGWWNWVPKAKAIYFFGRLDAELLEFFPNQTYPPGLPAVHAAAFHAMGSPDDVTLHLQYWTYVVAFVTALVGLLKSRVHQTILIPTVLILLVLPSFITRWTWTYADLPLGYLVATAAILLALWTRDRTHWQLVTATVLLTGAMLTKREGVLFAGCVLLAAAVGSWPTRRSTWPRLAFAGAAALALAAPWRIWVWVTTDGSVADAPSAGTAALSGGDRAWRSLQLAVETLFDREFWLVAPVLGVVAVGLALLARGWSIALYAATFVVTAAGAATVAIWSERFPITQDDAQNPIVRMTGTSVLVIVALTPMLLQSVWTRSRGAGTARVTPGPDAFVWRTRGVWAVVVAAALVYPASMLFGYSGQTLPGGTPRFPSTSDCVADVIPGEPVRVVVGYADSYQEAYATRARARRAGLRQVRVSQDGCGRLRVYVDGLADSRAAEVMSTARAEGMRPTLEGGPA